MKYSIKAKIIAGFIFIVVTTFSVDAAVHFATYNNHEKSMAAIHRYNMATMITTNLLTEVLDDEKIIREYIAGGGKEKLAAIEAHRQIVQQNLLTLEDLLAGDEEALNTVTREMKPALTALEDSLANGRLAPDWTHSFYKSGLKLLNQINSLSGEMHGSMAADLDDNKTLPLLSVILSALAIFFGFLIARSITSPLRVLMRGIQGVRKGNFQLIEGVRSQDEFGTLVETFNEMATTVQTHSVELEGKNEELQAQSEELAAQNEEIIAQQEELRATLEDLSAREELLNNLYHFSQSLTQTIKLDDLLATILDGLMSEAAAQVGALYLVGNKVDELVLRTSRSLIRAEDVTKWKLGEGLLGQAAQNKQVTIATYSEGLLRTKGLHGEMALLSEIYCPIVFQDTLLGVAVVGRTQGQPYDCNEKQHIAGLTDQAAVALHNSLAYLETQKALIRTQEIDNLKSELLSTVSHELRTPLASILGFAELLIKRPPTPEKARKYLETIYNESVRLTGLVNNFLDLQRIETGRFEFAKKSVDLRELVLNTGEIYQAQSGNHEITVKVQDDLPRVMVDPDRMTQVLGNLLSNAIKYSPSGGLIEIRAFRQGAYLEVEVEDHGLGIPDVSKNNIFQPFFRVDNSDRRKIGGTGLGLAISRKIIRAHGGDINFRSVYGEGSTFTVRIPIYETREERKEDIPAASLGKVLLVEDDEAMANLISEALRENGYYIRVERDGPGALAAVRKDVPEVIILDLILEGPLDGWAVLRRLKEYGATVDIPVIISSCLDEKQKGAEMGASAFLVKPFSVEELVACIKTFSHVPAGAIGLGRSQKLHNADKELRELIESKGFTVKELINRNELSIVILQNGNTGEAQNDNE